MLNHRHKKFILTPVSIYIEDCIDAISNVEDGIESFSLGEYIMQSLFMKMTGAQEQKMKCICWELATVDYNFRREFLKEKATEGFSSLESKTFVYKSLINFLSEYIRK